MRIIVLIGGMGSGKTTVMNLFSDLGAVCLDLDQIGHGVLEQPAVHQALLDRFGLGIEGADGTIDRRALAACAFADEQATRALEAIVQPAIVEQTNQLLDAYEADGVEVAIVEISAYKGPGGAFDELLARAQALVAVLAPAETRMQRALAQGFDRQDVCNRMARQATDEQRASWADFAIDNGGTLDELGEQVRELWARIGSESED